MQQYMYGTKICDIYDLQKCFVQTWVDFEQNVIKAAIDQWSDSLRSRMHADCGHFEHMLRSYSLFRPMCMIWFIRTLYQNCHCNLVHLTAVCS